MPRKKPPPALVVDISTFTRTVPTPVGLGERGRKHFQALLEELFLIRGTPFPSDIELVAMACRAYEASLDLHADADEMAAQGNRVEMHRLLGAALAQERAYSGKLSNLALSNRSRGIRRTQAAQATIGRKRDSKWHDVPGGSIL